MPVEQTMDNAILLVKEALARGKSYKVALAYAAAEMNTQPRRIDWCWKQHLIKDK